MRPLTTGGHPGLVLPTLVAFLCVGAPAVASEPKTEVGIDEKLGEHVPLELVFTAEDGTEVSLEELVDRPTILALVYFRCTSICNPLLREVGDMLGKVDLEPGRDFRVLTVSFDPGDGPADARAKKKAYYDSCTRELDDDAWRFLTGDRESIAALTDAVGFRFVKRGEEFLHPGSLTILSAEGKVTRYLYGIRYLPFDFKMGVLEASTGRVGTTVNKVLLYCFRYDPAGRKYVFDILKVTGVMTIAFGLLFVAYLVHSTRKLRAGAVHSGE